MRALLLLLCLTITTVSSEAREHRFKKKIVPHKLHAELRAGGFAIERIECFGQEFDDCRAIFPDAEKKDPTSVIQAHVYEDLRAERLASRNEAILLVKKLKAQDIANAERDRLLYLMAKMLALD